MKARKHSKRIAAKKAQHAEMLNAPLRDLPMRVIKAHIDRELEKLDASYRPQESCLK